MMGEGERGSICSGISTRLVSSHFGSEMWSHRVDGKKYSWIFTRAGGKEGRKMDEKERDGKGEKRVAFELSLTSRSSRF